MTTGDADGGVDPRALVNELRRRSLTIAAAESLTAGLVTARIAEVPGASEVLRGGVTTYATDTKADVLGVAPELLAHVVSQAVAEAMARRVRVLFGSDIGVATTGVAGPADLDGQPAGTAWIAVATAGGVSARLLRVEGDRGTVRARVADAALALALAEVTLPDAAE